MARLLLASACNSTRCTPSTSNAQASTSRVISRPRPPATQSGDEQAHRVLPGVLLGVHIKDGAADAVAVVFDLPAVGAEIWRRAARGQILAGVVATAVPLSPPRRAVAVFFLGVDG